MEDLFSLAQPDEVIEGTFIGTPPPIDARPVPLRVKVATVGTKAIVRPVNGLGDVLSYTVPADGYLIDTISQRSGVKARVRLSRDRQSVERDLSVAGCDPAIFLAGEHLRRQKDRGSVIGWTMGSTAALQALERGEVHGEEWTIKSYGPVVGERKESKPWDVVNVVVDPQSIDLSIVAACIVFGNS